MQILLTAFGFWILKSMLRRVGGEADATLAGIAGLLFVVGLLGTFIALIALYHP